MERQAIEMIDELMSEEADMLASSQSADLKLTDAESNEVKGGAICHGKTVLAWARVDGASPLPNHNKTLAEDAADEHELEDLLLTAVQEADIKAGCLNCWGPPLTNHNETVAGDTDDETDATTGKFAHQASVIEQDGALGDLEPSDDVMGGATSVIRVKRSGVLVEPTP